VMTVEETTQLGQVSPADGTHQGFIRAHDPDIPASSEKVTGIPDGQGLQAVHRGSSEADKLSQIGGSTEAFMKCHA
jgi:hypothetical protein